MTKALALAAGAFVVFNRTGDQMEIELHEAREWPLPSGAVQKFPAGWSGLAPAAAAAKWIAEGAARAIVGEPVQGALTPRQQAVLARAADEIDRLNQQTAGAADGVPLDGSEEVDLTKLSDEQLRAIATQLGIKLTRKLAKRDALIAAIVDKAQPQPSCDEGDA